MKASFREQMRLQLMGLPAETVRAHSLAIRDRLAAVPGFSDARHLCVYISIGHEIITHDLIRRLLAEHRQVCVPAFVPHGYVPARIIDFDGDLIAGKFGILEPKTVQPVPVDQPDCWLVPGLAFDRSGNRLGRGKGYYDALLQHAHGLKIALAHDFQLQPEIPVESHDIRVDFIITETQVLNCRETL